ncbi:MAG: DNA mismatch repair endonuclease MutL, partial [Pirellulaceae bacterium]
MPIIRQLPPSVINKIAAGEVIERPASVVKELLENAIDAGATRIDVRLEHGGLELVRVADNGVGMIAEQLPLAVASHATSKIQDADDLFRVATLGFRGEALASIAEISQLTIRSRTAEAEAGAELLVHGGQLGPVVPCGCPCGTTFEVRHLFFNTPVRRKFMRSTQTELGHAVEAFTRIALAFPAVHFTLRHGERIVHDVPPTDNWRERIVAFFGPEIAEDLIWVESDEEVGRLCGFVAGPSQSRSHNRMQYLFLNGRFIRDRSLQHALGEAYRGLLLTGRFPIAFLRLELRPDGVDVNVHPTKLEVRFEDSGRIYSQLLGTVRARFLSTDLTARVTAPAELRVDPAVPSAVGQPSGMDPETMEQHRKAAASWARGEATVAASFQLDSRTVEPRQAKFDFQPQPAWRPIPAFRPFSDNDRSWPPATPPDAIHRGDTDLRSASPGAAETGAANTLPSEDVQASTRGPRTGLQILNRYLVTEDDDGMVVIDQHALHERILYEQIRQRVLGGRLESQRLLVPETVPLLPAEAAAVLDAQPTLAQMGLEVAPFGGDTVLVSAYPAMLTRMAPAEVLRQAVDLLMSGGKSPDRRDLLDELLHLISCKAAVKAGDRLTGAEVDALLEQRHLYQDTHH